MTTTTAATTETLNSKLTDDQLTTVHRLMTASDTSQDTLRASKVHKTQVRVKRWTEQKRKIQLCSQVSTQETERQRIRKEEEVNKSY